MAKLYVTEYNDYNLNSAQEPPVAVQAFTYSTTTQSSAFAAGTRLIRVHTDSICSVLVGRNPTATTSSPRMAAGTTEYFSVEAGLKIAAVTNS
jgi:hypothetical protein